jgi:putative MATE family efflux protein
MQFHKRQDHTHNILDSERVGHLLVKLAVPSFMGMFVQSFYNVINTIFMGQYVDELAIAGLSIVFPIQMIMFGIAQLVGMGGSSLISRYIGAREEAKAERTLGNGLTAGVLMAAVFMIIVLPFSEFWLKLIGTSAEVMPYAKPYLIIVISCTVFNVFAMSLLAFTRAEGNTRVGMIAMITGAVLSIILDIIFVPVLHMGVIGAGLATVISQVVSLIYILSYYLSGSSYLKIRMKNLRLDFSILKPLFTIGLAGFLQTAAGSISSILLINMVIKYGGDVALSAYGIIQRLSMFAGMPAMVFGQALQPILGYNYGAKRYGLGLRAIKKGAVMATIAVVFTSAVLYLFPGPIISVFSNDQALLDIGIHASRLFFISLPLMGIMMVGQTIFQALGKAVQALITSFVRPIVFLIPLVLVMSNLWQLNGVFLSFPASDLLTFFLVIGLSLPVIYQLRKLAATQKTGTDEESASDELLPVMQNTRH